MSKKSHPELTRLRDRLAGLTAEFERSYGRLKRWFTRLEKVRGQVRRCARQLARMEAEHGSARRIAATAATSPATGKAVQG